MKPVFNLFFNVILRNKTQYYKRHNKYNVMINLFKYYTKPVQPRQRQYEAVRTVIVDKLTYVEAAKKFNYKVSTLKFLVHKAKAGLLHLFPAIKKGPRQKRTPIMIQQKIIALRKHNLSTVDIHHRLAEDKQTYSIKTIERIIKEAGFGKLSRRTYNERGLTPQGKIIPERSENLDFKTLEPFRSDCPIAGIFLFIPYIIESGILNIVNKCSLPHSNSINSLQATLAMLLIKLIGQERLSQISAFDKEPGLGLFAGLNILPKATYMCTYSCRTSEQMLQKFQRQLITRFIDTYPNLYGGKYINLDFHTIPHFGEESEMEKVWCGTKNKAVKGANTIFAQDSQHNTILYARADILRSEQSEEIKRFISFWRKVNGKVNETLVFDCNLTNYKILDEITDENIPFITLRKRNKKLIQWCDTIDEESWEKVKIDVPKRKYPKVKVYECTVKLNACKNTFRQVIIKDHGRKNPTFILTGNKELPLSKILEVYAKRWRIENKIAEMVSFFNLNALSSPLMIRIHFDILWTVIANTLYLRFAQDLRRFEKHLAPAIFRKFINMPGVVNYDGKKITVKIRKRAYTPILMSVDKFQKPFRVPWLNNLPLEIIWTA